MEFLILGPLEVRSGGRPVPVAGPRQRALLAILLIHANRVVSNDRLIEDLWGDAPPVSGVAALHMRVSALRRALLEGAPGSSPSRYLVTRAPGYVLQIDTEELDANRFERLLAAGRASMRAGDPGQAAVLLRQALDLWRGDPLADLADEPLAQPAIARLRELRASAIEERIEADLELGRHTDVIGELEAHVLANPLRERPRGQLMLALYRAGRQAEALQAFHAARRALIDDLGLEPGAPLQLLERQILRQDPSIEHRPSARPEPDVRAARPSPESRKTVTIAVTDVLDPSGLAAIDPERLRIITDRSVSIATSAFEHHGGVIESSLGTTVIAVFGIPMLHEDDALRALRGASSLRQTLSSLSDEFQRDFGVRVTARTGVATGEVITATAESGHLGFVGEPTILARRLQALAGTDEILLDDSTRRLTEIDAQIERVDLPDAARVWRLVDLARSVDAGAPTPSLVGRQNELAQLQSAFERAVHDRTIHVCTVLGTAGIGKSRLAQAFVDRNADRTTVVTGRCLAYGEGITFWPLREIIRQLAPGGQIADLLVGHADAELVARNLAGAVGLADATPSVEEIFRSVRRILEAVARERPLVVVLEDIHWAEPTLLALVEYLGLHSRGAGILMLLLTRPENREGRLYSGAAAANATSILLEPLTLEESQALVTDRLGPRHLRAGTRARIHSTAEGNPLYIEQLVALIAQEGEPSGELQIPPTIKALLAARIERLDPDERAVLERAAIVGREFSSSAVTELLPDDARPSARQQLEALIDKDLVRVDAGAAADEAFAFRHVLIQQSAYQSIPKQQRSEIHEAFAVWLERSAAEGLVEAEEVVGYHLEQAVRYRDELAPLAQSDRSLARRAGELLGSAGRRAFQAGDMPASANLLARATALLPPDDPVRLRLLSDLAYALFELGDLEPSSRVLAEVIDRGSAIADLNSVARATAQRHHVEMYRHPERVDAARLLDDGSRALAILLADRDAAGVARASLLLSEVHWTLGSGARAIEAAKQAARFARRSGSRREEAWSHGDYGYYAIFGPTTVADGTRQLKRWLAQAGGDAVLEANLSGFLAPLAAMEGRIEEARRGLAESRDATVRLGLRWQSGTHDLLAGFIEMLADDPLAAEVHLRQAIEMFTDMGDMWFASILSIEEARALIRQGRDGEASALVERLDALPADPSDSYKIRRSEVLGRLLSRSGEHAKARQYARKAIEIAGRTDFLGFHADALVALADILHRCGDPGAPEALGSAIELYERKGNVVEARKARAMSLDLRGRVARQRR